MLSLSLKDWLEVAKFATVIPALVAAWKLPPLWNWCKMRYATAVARAVMEQLSPTLDEMKADIASVRYQVFPNGGGSMSDQLNRVLASTQTTEHTVLVLRDTMRAHQDADVQQIRFEADPGGHLIWASLTMQSWCAKSLDQTTGFGWINCVAHEDREFVREEWNTAIAEGREFNMRFRMLDSAGSPFAVEAQARPLRNSGSAEIWVGVIAKTY